MTIFQRTQKGGLSVRNLDLQILFDELFDIAKNEEEVEWIYENLESVLEIIKEEKLDNLED